MGIRFSRVAADPTEGHTPTQGLGFIKNTFASLDGIELKDLLQHEESPFRVLATSSKVEQVERGLFSFVSQVELDAMSWQSHKIIPSDWGFQVSPAVKKRRDAIHQLIPPTSYFDRGKYGHFAAFRSVSYEDERNIISIDLQHLTAQWNPSTIIAVQRFVGRLKKAARSILLQPTANENSAGSSVTEPSLAEPASSCHKVMFSVDADVESICICLSEYLLKSS